MWQTNTPKKHDFCLSAYSIVSFTSCLSVGNIQREFIECFTRCLSVDNSLLSFTRYLSVNNSTVSSKQSLSVDKFLSTLALFAVAVVAGGREIEIIQLHHDIRTVIDIREVASPIDAALTRLSSECNSSSIDAT